MAQQRNVCWQRMLIIYTCRETVKSIYTYIRRHTSKSAYILARYKKSGEKVSLAPVSATQIAPSTVTHRGTDIILAIINLACYDSPCMWLTFNEIKV